jgi:tRNA pseudouridine38-40 synthase
LRILAITTYDGSKFFGLQSQKNEKNTVLGHFSVALSKMGIFSKLLASGRTDAGVHATYQPITFDLPEFWIQKMELFGVGFLLSHLNKQLSPYIYVKKLYSVQDDFHPRFDAVRRVYRYVLTQSYSPFLADYAGFAANIDKQKIKHAIKLFEGRHDFGLFRKKGSDNKSDVREIFGTSAYEHKEFFVLRFEANSFLRSQIRLMSSALLKISSGELSEDELLEQLNGEKQHSTSLAPPSGLYLCDVCFKNEITPLK